jgi:uncharacterized membrane protein
MNKYLAAYLAAALVMVVLDMLWLRVVAKTTYQQAIGHLMAEKPKVLAAIVFYALYPLGLMVFALLPQAEHADGGRTVFTGGHRYKLRSSRAFEKLLQAISASSAT